ncbi:MAG: AlpA family phage regulatory protein [bacterium]|nr:AlpA family phage regulatory protein [bacterium]MDE0600170.1 AlpA family phage regulatory protein [bacterium]
MNIREVSEYVGLDKSTIYRRIAKGDFPKQRRLSPNRVGWLRAEVEQWLSDRQEPDSPAGSTRSR